MKSYNTCFGAVWHLLSPKPTPTPSSPVPFISSNSFSSTNHADILLGDVPNIYVYACNNPSESTLAKRRGYGTCDVQSQSIFMLFNWCLSIYLSSCICLYSSIDIIWFWSIRHTLTYSSRQARSHQYPHLPYLHAFINDISVPHQSLSNSCITQRTTLR